MNVNSWKDWPSLAVSGLEPHFDTPADALEKTNEELRSFKGVGPATIKALRAARLAAEPALEAPLTEETLAQHAPEPSPEPEPVSDLPKVITARQYSKRMPQPVGPRAVHDDYVLVTVRTRGPEVTQVAYRDKHGRSHDAQLSSAMLLKVGQHPVYGVLKTLL